MLRISYPLDRKSPLYPGTPPVTFTAFKSIAAGDSADNTILSLSSHSGTHIDLPRHFCPGGASVRDMLGPVSEFSPVFCCDIKKQPGDAVTPEDFAKVTIPPTTRALLVRTGFFRHRTNDPALYTTGHPWVSPDLAGYLRERWPDLAVFGMDTISIGSPAQREAGRSAHRSFLCGRPPIMLLEDLDLSAEHLMGRAWSLILAPLILDELDGVPVLAFLD